MLEYEKSKECVLHKHRGPSNHIHSYLHFAAYLLFDYAVILSMKEVIIFTLCSLLSLYSRKSVFRLEAKSFTFIFAQIAV